MPPLDLEEVEELRPMLLLEERVELPLERETLLLERELLELERETLLLERELLLEEEDLVELERELLELERELLELLEREPPLPLRDWAPISTEVSARAIAAKAASEILNILFIVVNFFSVFA